jgi:hypothetical protein
MSSLLKLVIDVLVDDAGLADRLVPQKDDLYLNLPRYGAHRVVHHYYQIVSKATK